MASTSTQLETGRDRRRPPPNAYSAQPRNIYNQRGDTAIPLMHTRHAASAIDANRRGRRWHHNDALVAKPREGSANHHSCKAPAHHRCVMLEPRVLQ